MKDKTCLITRTTRTQCQYCRYTKCINVGMKLSGKEFIYSKNLLIKLLNRRNTKSKN